jgi:predicted PurR-regulated permease PerM
MMDAPAAGGATPGGARTVTLALVAVVAILLLPFVSGLIGGAVLYVIAAPAMRRIDRFGHRRTTAFLITFVLFVLLVLPGIWLVAQLLAQLPAMIAGFQDAAALRRIMTVRLGTTDLGSLLDRASGDIVSWSSRQTMAALNGALGATLNLVIALFGAYYLLISGDRIWRRVKSLLPLNDATAELLRRRFHRVTEAMLLGVVLTSAAQGALVGGAFALLGFEQALLWGAVTAAVSILPVFGSAIVWFPASLLLMAQGRLGAALALGAFGALLVSNVDNALRLVVYRRVSQIHPMVTLVGAFAGVRAFGVAGVLLGPLVLSWAIELLRLSRPGSRVYGLPAGQGFPRMASVAPPTSRAPATS